MGKFNMLGLHPKELKILDFIESHGGIVRRAVFYQNKEYSRIYYGYLLSMGLIEEVINDNKYLKASNDRLIRNFMHKEGGLVRSVTYINYAMVRKMKITAAIC